MSTAVEGGVDEGVPKEVEREEEANSTKKESSPFSLSLSFKRKIKKKKKIKKIKKGKGLHEKEKIALPSAFAHQVQNLQVQPTQTETPFAMVTIGRFEVSAPSFTTVIRRISGSRSGRRMSLGF